MSLLHKCVRNFRRGCKYSCICVLILICLWILTTRDSRLSTSPCNIEILNPWDPSVVSYFTKLDPVQCSPKQQLIFIDRSGVLRFDENVAKLYKFNTSAVNCFYYPLKRGIGDTYNVTFGTRVHIKLPCYVKCHMFRIQCNSSAKIVYDFLHFNPTWNENVKNDSDIEDETVDTPSVIVFGIDSVSRSHAIRALPKSFKFLASEFQAYDFVGHNRVGENTWRNFIPLLAGKSHRKYLITLHMIFHVDLIPFIWYEKELAKVATLYAEDRPELSAFTVFGQLGFKRPPTDYYFRTFTQGVNSFIPKIIDEVTNSKDCYGPRTMFDTQIDYLKGFLLRYKNKRKFAMSWNTQISHSSYSLLSRSDDAFLEFLDWMKSSNQTKNAIFIVMSDHGPRMGGAALTHVGRAENNKPWMMLHIPNNLKTKYKWIHETVLQNSKQLTSHYDTYETIFDIFRNKAFSTHTLKTVQNFLTKRNLFHPLPKDRTCIDAGIEDQFCTCDRKSLISPKQQIVQSMANFLVEEINTLLSKHLKLCGTFTLHNITEVLVSYSKPEEDLSIYEQTMKLVSKDRSGRYKIVFYAVPGNALFEGTVDFVEVSSKKIDRKMSLIGEVIRLDRYDTKSKCMKDKFIRPYCVCQD